MLIRIISQLLSNLRRIVVEFFLNYYDTSSRELIYFIFITRLYNWNENAGVIWRIRWILHSKMKLAIAHPRPIPRITNINFNCFNVIALKFWFLYRYSRISRACIQQFCIRFFVQIVNDARMYHIRAESIYSLFQWPVIANRENKINFYNTIFGAM